MINKELYIDIPNQKDYKISNKGNVVSFKNKTKRILKPTKTNKGYLYVSLSNKKVVKHTIHRLVADSFLDNPSNFPCVNHKDGNKLNNNVSNLEWCTYSENNQHAYDKKLKKVKSGLSNHKSRFTREQVVEIRRLYDMGGISHKRLEEMFNIPSRTIGEMVARRTYKDVI